MPLSKPAPRQHVHTREIRCLGYKRDDGLWDIEARITDAKTYSFENIDRGGINAGEHIHDMHVRVTLDDDAVIQHAEAATDASPYHACNAINDAYSALKGIRIAPGWRKAVLERVGRVKGCTHITELLLGPIATTAFQTLRGSKLKDSGEEKSDNRKWVIDTCHALARDGAVAQREWPDLNKTENGDG